MGHTESPLTIDTYDGRDVTERIIRLSSNGVTRAESFTRIGGCIAMDIGDPGRSDGTARDRSRRPGWSRHLHLIQSARGVSITMTAPIRFALGLACSCALASLYLHGQVPNVTSERLVRAAKEPQNWLMYSGTYLSQRYSTLDQINLSNLKNLEQKWVYQGAVVGPWQATPLVVDGVMYVSQRPNDVVALDARTGRV